MANRSSARKWAIGTILAAIIGYVAGILTAPKSGKETRQDLKEVAQKNIIAAEKQIKRLQDELSTLVIDTKEKSAKLTSQAKEEFTAVLAQATKAKDKAKEVIGAAKKGSADDRDLQKAVTEATKAVNHFKNYLDKM